VGGDLGGTWGGQGFELKRVKSETQTSASGADPARYWSFWVNYTHMTVGLCDPGFELQEGDDVIILVDCYSAIDACDPAQPLRLRNVPPTVAPGQTVTVRVDEYGVEDPAAYPTVTKSQPSAGATITYGGATATTAADGTARLTFTEPGPVSLRVEKADRVRTAELTCVTSGNDGSCGTQLPPTAVLGTEKPDDKTAPVASFSRLKNGRVYSRRNAPRRLSGTVTPDESGIKSVRLGIHRRVGERCWTFDGASERFERHRCGGRSSFRIGDRADWSYLLPKRLPKGRYTIRAVAVDNAGNDSARRVRMRVR
jgi:hypothetical protein